EGIFDSHWIGQNHRALTEIVDSQRRQNDCYPGKLYWTSAEMSEIGVKRLRARHREEDCAEGEEGNLAMRQQEIDSVQRIDGCQYPGIDGDVVEPRQGDRDEPDRHDRTEQR